MTSGPGDARDPHRSPVVLALVGYYPPAFLAGGPTRSVPRIADRLGDELQFQVITRDSDFGASTPLSGIAPDRWLQCGRARCRYLSARARRLGGIGRVIRATPHDVLYINSLFDFDFSLVPLLLRRLGRLPRRGLVIAPRGELDASALSLKRRRKRLYLLLARRLGLFRDATWHAATLAEARAIDEVIRPRTRPRIARDIPAAPPPARRQPERPPGDLRLVFLGRISPMKNLDFAFDVLRRVRGPVTFTVHGPIEDREYWAACLRLAEALPPNITWRYAGPISPDDVLDVLGAHDILFLPSRAESFGHAIVEALSAGLPVLIGDQTPWRGLEPRRAGWDLPLSKPELFADAIDGAIRMSPAELAEWSLAAATVGREIAEDSSLDDAYRALFRAGVEAA